MSLHNIAILLAMVCVGPSRSATIPCGSGDNRISDQAQPTAIEVDGIRPAVCSVGTDRVRTKCESRSLGNVNVVLKPEAHFTHSGRVPRVCAVAFGPQSRYLAAADLDRGLDLWDLENRRKVWRVVIPPIGSVSEEKVALAFASDGKLLVLTSAIRAPLVLNARKGTILRALGSSDQRPSPALAILRLNGDEAAVTVSANDIHFWSPSSGRRLMTWSDVRRHALSLDIAREQNRIALGMDNGHTVVRDVRSGATVVDLRVSRFPVWHVAISCCGKRIVAGNNEGLFGWQIDDNLQLWRLEEGCVDLDIDPDGETFVYANRGEQATVRSIGTGKVVGVMRIRSKAINAVAFNSRGSLIATGAYDGTLTIWRVGS